jgi:hypothetical protein
MAKRKTNRAKYFGPKRKKTVRHEVLNNIQALEPMRSRDEAWAYYDEMDHLEFSRIKPPQAA